MGEEFSIWRNQARTVVSGNILASAHGGVGYLQPRGRVSSPSSSSSILQHLKVNKRLQTVISQQLYTQHLYSKHIQ